MRVLVVGGGINGLLTARELVLAGHEVVLVERGEVGQESSWAGGGIISPLYPWRYAPPVTALARWAQSAYPALSQALLAETGIDVELNTCGMLFLDAHDERDAVAWAQQQSVPVERITPADLHQRWPGVAADVKHALFMPHVANVRNPRLLKALNVALQQHTHYQVITQAEVSHIEGDSSQARVKLADGRVLEADQVVVCAGAWSALLLAPIQSLPIAPVRGQMQLYKLSPGQLPCMIQRGAHYLIPRLDGHVLCGSTLEHVGFDKSTTEQAAQTLRQAALSIWPALAQAPLIKQWSGLRPGSANGIPFIGALSKQPRVWINAGQFRNGLVLAPASARLLVDQLLGRTPVIDPAPYQSLG